MAMHTEIKRTTTTFVILAIAATLALVMVTSSIDSALAVRNKDIGGYSTTNSNPSSPETMGKNSIGNQDLNNFDQCVQKAALDGDGLGLNEVAGCYSQVFANGAMQSNG